MSGQPAIGANWQRILDPLSPIFVAERTRITVHLTVALGRWSASRNRLAL
jgi:hypothetical protein